jgi:hypothetical protein
MRLAARRSESSWLEPGVLVDGHLIVRQLHGHSGQELRYLARSPDDTPAMVISTRHVFIDRRERSRFRRASSARAALDHPAAIRIRAVTEHASQPVLIADPYPERTLGDLLERDAPLASERVVALLAPVADALDRAHAAGVVHSTLSADSLLLTDPERLLLDAFGLLAEEEGGWSLPEGRDVRYISPEQVRGLPALPSSNVYSLTALAVHALTGDAPFTGEPPAVLYAHVIKAPARLSERRPELGQRIDAVVSAGLAKEPEDRPSSATELLQQIADALGVPRPDARPRRRHWPRLRLVRDDAVPAAPPRGRRRVPILLTAAVLAAAVGLGAVAAVAVAPFGDDGASRPAPSPAAGGVRWKQLAGERAALRDHLAAAETPRAQADAASALGGLYARAARTGQPRALAAAASDASAAYERLATAAGLHDEAGYLDAAQAVERAEGRLSLAASRH